MAGGRLGSAGESQRPAVAHWVLGHREQGTLGEEDLGASAFHQRVVEPGPESEQDDWGDWRGEQRAFHQQGRKEPLGKAKSRLEPLSVLPVGFDWQAFGVFGVLGACRTG